MFVFQAAIEFCMNFNTKVNRKKLVRGLFTVHRTRYVSDVCVYARMCVYVSVCVRACVCVYYKCDFGRKHIGHRYRENIHCTICIVHV